MANERRTAMGGAVDMDMLRLANENTIAIGNARTNAKGDQLGPGGKVIKTRAQVMQEYHALNTPVSNHEDDFIDEHAGVITTPVVNPPTNVLQPTAEELPIAESESIPSYTKPRGSFAEAVAGQTEVSQELLEPAASRNQPKGIQRI